jgi:hypothetical protein
MSDDPLLTYAISSDPNPLQAGVKGGLILSISNSDPSNKITLYSVSVTISVGNTAKDLTTTTAGIHTPAPAAWTAKFAQGSGVYTAKPDDTAGVDVTTRGIALEISEIAVNDQVGATVLYIDEDAKDSSGTSRKIRSREVTLAKFPARFKLTDLTAAPDPVVSGGSVTLSWLGSNMPGLVTYRLEWVSGSAPHSRDVTYTGPETITAVDTQPQTIFKLTAQVAGAPPVTRLAVVNVLPREPVIDVFRGDIVGNSIVLEWSVSNAEKCEIGGASEFLQPNGTRTLPIDRFRYTLTAYNRNKTARAVLEVKFVDAASLSAYNTFWSLIGALPDASLVLAMASYREWAVFDGTTLTRRNSVATGSLYAEGIAVSPRGTRTLMWSSGFAALFDSAFQIVQQTSTPLAAAFSPDESWLFLLFRSPRGFTLQQYTAADFRKVNEYNYEGVGGDGAALAFSPRGDRLFVYVARWETGSILTIDPLTGRELQRRPFTSRGGGPSMLSWQSGSQLFLAISTRAGEANTTHVIDAATMSVIREFPWSRAALTATEILGAKGNPPSIEIVDRATLTVEQTIPLTYGFSGFKVPLVVASRAIFHAEPRDRFHRYEGRSVERVALQQLEAHRATGLHYDVLRSDSTLVVVATAHEGMRIEDTQIEIDVAGEDVIAESPAGWSVTREGAHFTFTCANPGDDDTLAFTFRNAAAGSIRVHETRKRTVEMES